MSFIFTLLFLLDLVAWVAVMGMATPLPRRSACVMVQAVGVVPFLKDGLNAFDAVVVLSSIVELCVAPPSFSIGGDPHTGAATALRACRIFRCLACGILVSFHRTVYRILRLARHWTSLRALLVTVAHAVKDVGNFTLLLVCAVFDVPFPDFVDVKVLLVYIFALTGEQIFANRFRFDPITGMPVSSIQLTDAAVVVPRANFDTLLNAIACTFQVR